MRGIRRALPVSALVLLLGSPMAAVSDASRALGPGPVSVVQTTADLRQRLEPLASLHFSSAAPGKGTPIVRVDDARRYQTVSGFGAAMTDSSAWLIERRLSAATRVALMSRLFGAGGIRLGYLRVPVAASDFTVGRGHSYEHGRPYSYDDVATGRADPHLAHFSIAHDRGYVLPALTEARSLNPQIEFMASPWSPPAWMKRNDSLANNRNRGILRATAYRPYAAYLVRFIEAYAEAGIPITALTAQNEPQVAVPYPGMNISEPAEASWIVRDLRPALSRAHLNVKLYAGDLGWAKASVPYFKRSLSGPARSSFSGLAWHCYYGTPDVMGAFHRRHPAIEEIVDECSPGISAIPVADVVISSLRNWASTVALWNVALDTRGGPVQAPNAGCRGCYGLARIDARRGTVRLTSAYYELGQASRFIERGAVRVASSNFVSYDYRRPGVDFVSRGLDDVALLNPDGSHVLLAHNAARRALTFAVAWRGAYFRYRLPAGATATFTWSSTAG